MVTLHPAAVQGCAAGVVGDLEAGVGRQRRAVWAAFARIGRHRVFARFAHGRLARRASVLAAHAGDAVALLPFLI